MNENTDVNNNENGTQETCKKEFFFDKVGDFFQKMTMGILKFAFVKLPLFIVKKLFNWERWMDVVRSIKRAARAFFWMTVWVFIVFVAWIVFDINLFLSFWKSIASSLLSLISNIWGFIKEYFDVIWTLIALSGSLYGLLYVSVIKRKKRGVKKSEKVD